MHCSMLAGPHLTTAINSVCNQDWSLQFIQVRLCFNDVLIDIILCFSLCHFNASLPVSPSSPYCCFLQHNSVALHSNTRICVGSPSPWTHFVSMVFLDASFSWVVSHFLSLVESKKISTKGEIYRVSLLWGLEIPSSQMKPRDWGVGKEQPDWGWFVGPQIGSTLAGEKVEKGEKEKGVREEAGLRVWNSGLR